MDYDLKPSLGFTRLGFQAFLGRYQLMTSRTMQSAPGVSKSKATFDVSAGDFSFRSFAVRPLFTGRFEIGVDVNGRYGLRSSNLFLEFNDEENVVKRLEDVSIADASRSDVGVYSNSQWKLNRALTLGLGGRFDRITTRNEGGLFGEYATNNSALSGYGSVSVEMLRGLSLTGQLSRSFRDPMLSDRYYYGISGRGIVMGNPDLSPERANQFDTALRFTYARIRGAIYGYIYRLSNLIERFEIKPDEFYFRNQGVGDIRGLELELQTTLGNDFRVDFTTQISRGVTVGSAQYLDDIPTRDFKIVVRRELSERGYAILRFANFGMDAKPGPTEIVVPGYTTLDMGAGWKMSEKIELRGTIRNLLDQAYLITPDRRAVFAPGISGVFTVVAEF